MSDRNSGPGPEDRRGEGSWTPEVSEEGWRDETRDAKVRRRSRVARAGGPRAPAPDVSRTLRRGRREEVRGPVEKHTELGPRIFFLHLISVPQGV